MEGQAIDPHGGGRRGLASDQLRFERELFLESIRKEICEVEL